MTFLRQRRPAYRSEKWLAVPGYEEKYEVSDLGNIRSLDRLDSAGRPRKGKLLMPYRDGKDGYVAVSLVKDAVSVRVKIHRLVALVFHGVPAYPMHVNHKNGNPADNRAENLEWCTPSENVRHGFRVLGRKPSGGHKGKKGALHHCSKPVIATPVNGGQPITFSSTKEAAETLGIPSGSIPRCCSGKYKQSHGFTFRYMEAGNA